MRVVNDDLFAVWRNRNDRVLLATRIRRHDMIVAYLRNFLGARLRINKFEPDQVTRKEPASNGLRLAPGYLEVHEFGAIFGPLLMIGNSQDSGENLRLVLIPDFHQRALFTAILDPNGIRARLQDN